MLAKKFNIFGEKFALTEIELFSDKSSGKKYHSKSCVNQQKIGWGPETSFHFNLKKKRLPKTCFENRKNAEREVIFHFETH